MKNIEKVAVLVDNQNIYYSAQSLYGGLIDYKTLINQLVGERKLVHVSAFVVRGHTGEEPFFEALRRFGIKLRIKEIQIFKNGAKKADWDMGIAVEAIMLADHVDTIVIVSGDGDFIPLVRYLKNVRGKRVEVAAFGRHTSMRLKLVADKFHNLEFSKEVVFKPRSVNHIRNPIHNRVNGLVAAN